MFNRYEPQFWIIVAAAVGMLIYEAWKALLSLFY
jgi:hypothetical protein